MKLLNANFFQMTNAIFSYGLSPNELAVYSYLVSCTGSKDKCWPSVKVIAANCNISENTVRKAVKVLDKRGFIRKVETTRYTRNGVPHQGNNNYFLLDLPDLPVRAS